MRCIAGKDLWRCGFAETDWFCTGSVDWRRGSISGSSSGTMGDERFGVFGPESNDPGEVENRFSPISGSMIGSTDGLAEEGTILGDSAVTGIRDCIYTKTAK